MGADGPIIEVAAEGELPEILALQKLAFLDAARECGDYSIPPLVQTLEELREECRRDSSGASTLVLVARVGERLVGTVRSRRKGETCMVLRLAVHPDFRRRGVARCLVAELERRNLIAIPAPTRFELFTAASARGAVALYEGCGYRAFRTHQPETGPLLVYMEKAAAS